MLNSKHNETFHFKAQQTLRRHSADGTRQQSAEDWKSSVIPRNQLNGDFNYKLSRLCWWASCARRPAVKKKKSEIYNNGFESVETKHHYPVWHVLVEGLNQNISNFKKNSTLSLVMISNCTEQNSEVFHPTIKCRTAKGSHFVAFPNQN